MVKQQLRPPQVVMQLERLGAFHQTRLSFARSLVRQMVREQWQIVPTRFDLDDDGYGTAVYTITATNSETYSAVMFTQPLADEERTDRVIAEKWDIASVLCDGEPDEARLAELRQHVPKQEAGRNRTDVLVLSRANKSGRNFRYVTECLAAGQQPDPAKLIEVGYLVRTTAVYGNGKFGLADYAKLQERQTFRHPFRAQMLMVYMIRHFAAELVDHLARRRAPETAVSLHPNIRRFLGVGNATGLGMAPFLIKHPQLIHQWIATREKALARVLEAEATEDHLEQLRSWLGKTAVHFQETITDNERQHHNNQTVIAELPQIKAYLDELDDPSCAWQQLMGWASQTVSLESQELLVSLLFELYPERVDSLEEEMAVRESIQLDPTMTVQQLKTLIKTNYRWAIDINFDEPAAQHLFWYRSAKKEEPRLGERFLEPGAEKEQKLGIGRFVHELYHQLQQISDNEQGQSIVYFLLQRPHLRGVVQRVQTMANYPYGEIQSNLLDADCLPIHLLRCKLSFFGASKFDPKSRLWTRITLFQGAPLVDELRQPLKSGLFPVAPKRTVSFPKEIR